MNVKKTTLNANFVPCGCTMRLYHTYSWNKSSNIDTFNKSYLWDLFQRTVDIYEKYKDASWNNKFSTNKKTIENDFCCILM